MAATFISAGECWDSVNVANGIGGVTISYFRCQEASTTNAGTTTILNYTPTMTTENYATATTYPLTTNNLSSSSTENHQPPVASASSTLFSFNSTSPPDQETLLTSLAVVASTYISSSIVSNNTISLNPSPNDNKQPSPLPIILAVIFATLFTLLLLTLGLIFYLRRRRRRGTLTTTPFYSPSGSRGEGILSDRRISSGAFSSRASTTSYTPEPTFIQPVVVGLGMGAGGGRVLTSREKRLSNMRRPGTGWGAVEEGGGGGGWEENGDEVLRRKMEGWNAVAERRLDTTRFPEEEEEEGDVVVEKNPFDDSYGVLSTMRNTTLPSLPPPLRLPLTITTSLAPPRSSSSHHQNPLSSSPSPSPSPNPTPLSPQFDPNYSPTTTESRAPLLGQAEDGGVSLMGGNGRSGGQAPPPYLWL